MSLTAAAARLLSSEQASWGEAVERVRQLLRNRQYDEGLDSVLNFFRLDKAGNSSGGGSSGSRSRPREPSISTSGLQEDTIKLWDSCSQQLVLLGAQCCNRMGENSLLDKDWQRALKHATAALPLLEGRNVEVCDPREQGAWQDKWRSNDRWAGARFRALSCAAEAHRAVDDRRVNLEASRGYLLKCEEMLDAWPASDWHSEDVHIFTILAEVQRLLQDLAAARRSCLRALASLASPGAEASSGATLTKAKGIFAAVFVLWVLQNVALEDHCPAEAEATLQCARHVAIPVRRRAQADSGDAVARRIGRLLQQMKHAQQQKAPHQPQEQLPRTESPDLQWFLAFESGSDRMAAGDPARQSALAATTRTPTVVGTSGAAATPPKPPPPKAIERVLSPTQRRAQADIQQVKGLCLLAISVSAPGRTFPIWRLAVGAKEKLSKVMSMWASKHLGCGNLPEGVCAFAGNGGPPLDLRDRLQQLAPMLPVRDARLAVAVTWPALPPQEAIAAVTVRSSTSHSKLGKLAISTRYSSVDREAMGYHQSSNYDSKVEAGEYDETFGQYLQAGYIEAMRTPPASDADAAREAEESIETLELSVFSKVSDQVVFTATLRGPKALVDNWEATCEAFEHKKEECQDLPFPVFIPSRGRPLKANLNWEASHVYGDLLREDETKTLRPVVCVALEQEDEPEYRQVWPSILALVLPKSGQGPGYVRWVIQTLCTKAYICRSKRKPGSPSKKKMCRVPKVWVVDDSLSMFYQLVALEIPWDPDHSGIQRLKRREAPEGARMFHDAFMAVQRHKFSPRAAVAGFLRDDGTAVCKRIEWKADELSLYKVVLLNLNELNRLGVQYQQDLRMYEDIFLTHQVIQAGGHTLKCQCFCFRASHHKHGGCVDRQTRGHGGTGTRLEDMIAPSALQKLSQHQRIAVTGLYEWVKKKESGSLERRSAQNRDPSKGVPAASAPLKNPKKRAEAPVRKEKGSKRVDAMSKKARRSPQNEDEDEDGQSSSSGSESSSSASSSSSSPIAAAIEAAIAGVEEAGLEPVEKHGEQMAGTGERGSPRTISSGSEGRNAGDAIAT